MRIGDIGVSINGVILRNVYSLSSPSNTTTAPDSIYSLSLDLSNYYDYENNYDD